MSVSSNSCSVPLGNRLRSIASLVPSGAVPADIGTDHGYLMAYLWSAGVISKGFACDINEKPLAKAAATLRGIGADGCVSVILSDGLSALREESFSHVMIAGMGGDLIFRILEQAPWCRGRNLTYLLQPMTKPHHLRKKLYENGFRIVRELPSVEKGFPYTVMEAVFDGICRMPSMEMLYMGALSPASCPESLAYGKKVLKQLQIKCAGREKSAGTDSSLSAMKAYAELLRRQLGENHEG